MVEKSGSIISMKHLLEISKLTKTDIENLLVKAQKFKQELCYPKYSEICLANLFYEPSTRTRVSFELGAKRLSLMVTNIDSKSSSSTKGETILDTITTLEAMGVNLIVLRHTEDYLPLKIAKSVKNISIINAGDGMHAHPSQALLDLMTIIETKPKLEKLKIAIVGDILHSRVANSLQLIFAIMNVGELILITPKYCEPSYVHYGTVTHSLENGLKDCDVIIVLRVQKERFKSSENFDIDDYINFFKIEPKVLANARPDAILMHPGPVNRDVEIENSLVDSKYSKILLQVQNGVFMRMAILDTIIRENNYV